MPIKNTDTDKGVVSAANYPRTGKRGVPQQFPRRLYEMLQSESKFIEESADHPKVIWWAESGRAFRIADVAEFSTTILPKYFRTNKYSSFQRNLNLYGFAKVRRGPETDMYAHPSFMRDRADLLGELRKLAPTSNRRRSKEGSTATKRPKTTTRMSSKSVSPSPTRMLGSVQFQALSPSRMPVPPINALHNIVKPTPAYASPQHTSMWAPIHKVPPSPEKMVAADASQVVVNVQPPAPSTPSKPNPVGGGLDLLAFAMEAMQ